VIHILYSLISSHADKLLIFKLLATYLLLTAGKVNHCVILGDFEPEVLDGAQGIKTRVYPCL